MLLILLVRLGLVILLLLQGHYDGRFTVKVHSNAGYRVRGGFPAARHTVLSLVNDTGVVRDILIYQGGYVRIRGKYWLDRNLAAGGKLAQVAIPLGLVRVHSSCATGDIFGSMRCDCGEQLHKAMEVIEKAGKGVIVYLNQEGRGIGLMEKMRAYKLQEDGMDTVDANICLGHLADERDYGVGAQILRELGVHKMRLLTNNPVKRVGLEAYGLEIVENVPVETTPNQYNERYLRTKKERMGHTLHFSK
jgi:GTP cyclohydrolase II